MKKIGKEMILEKQDVIELSDFVWHHIKHTASKNMHDPLVYFPLNLLVAILPILKDHFQIKDTDGADK